MSCQGCQLSGDKLSGDKLTQRQSLASSSAKQRSLLFSSSVQNFESNEWSSFPVSLASGFNLRQDRVAALFDFWLRHKRGSFPTRKSNRCSCLSPCLIKNVQLREGAIRLAVGRLGDNHKPIWLLCSPVKHPDDFKYLSFSGSIVVMLFNLSQKEVPKGSWTHLSKKMLTK